MSDKNGNPNSYVNRLFRSIEGDSAVVKEKSLNSIGQSTNSALATTLGQLDSKSEVAVALSSLKSSLSSDFNAIRSMIRKQDTVISGLKKTAGGAVMQTVELQGKLTNQIKGLNRQVNELQSQVRDIRKDLDKLKKNAGQPGMGGGLGSGTGSGLGSAIGTAVGGWAAWKTLGAIGRVAGAALPYAAPLAVGAGALYGLNKIGEANEARDKKLGIDKDSTQDEIEAKRKKFHRDRKNKGYRELHEETNKLRQKQGEAPINAPIKAASYRAPVTKTQTFERMSGQKYDLSFADNYYREKVQDQKAEFMKFGRLPGGFEFTEGYMGRLGTPAALRAAGIQPLSGGGSYTPGPSRSSYVPSGNYTSPPQSNQGQQPPAANQGTGTRPGQPTTPGQSTAPGTSTVTNNGQVERFSHLATERERFKQELEANPALKAKLLAVARSESGNQTGWTSTMEALFNRMSAHNAVGHGPKTIADALKDSRGSYYDPIRTGIWRQRDAMIRSNPALAAQLEQAYQDAINGSNRSNLATQEGSAGVAASAARTQTIVAGPKTHGGQTFSRKDVLAYAKLHGLKVVQGEKNWAERNQALIDAARRAAQQGQQPPQQNQPPPQAGSKLNVPNAVRGRPDLPMNPEGFEGVDLKVRKDQGAATNDLYEQFGLQAKRPAGMMKLGGPEQVAAQAKKMMVLGLPGLGNQLDPNALTRYMQESGASGVQKLFNQDGGWSPDWLRIQKSIFDAQKMGMGFNVMAHSAGVQTLRDMQQNIHPEAWKYFSSNLNQAIATGAHRNIGNGSIDQLKALYGDKLKMFGDFSSRGLNIPMLKAKHFDMPNAALDQLYPKTVGRADQAPPQPKPMSNANNLSQGTGLPDVGVATPGTVAPPPPAAAAKPLTSITQFQPQAVSPEQFKENKALGHVDPRLKHIIEEAAKDFPLRVRAFSGSAGRSGSGQHPAGKAMDVQLHDENGRPISSYQTPQTSNIYAMWAEHVRKKQMELYPQLKDQFAWGGGFQGMTKGGGSGVYGAADHMHFDLGGANRMNSYKWDKGWQKGHEHYTDRDFLGIGARKFTPEDYEKLKGFKLTDEQDAEQRRTAPRNAAAGMWSHKNIGPRSGEQPVPVAPNQKPGQPPGPGPSTGTGPVPVPQQQPTARGPNGDILTNMQNNMGDDRGMIPWDATMPKPSNSGRIMGIPINPYFNPFKGHWDPNPNATGPILGKLSKEDYDKHRDPDAKPEERDPHMNLEREFEQYKPIQGADPNYVGANPNAPPEEAPKAATPPPGQEPGTQPPSGPVATNPGEFPSFKGDDQQESPGDGGSGSYGRCFV